MTSLTFHYTQTEWHILNSRFPSKWDRGKLIELKLTAFEVAAAAIGIGHVTHFL